MSRLAIITIGGFVIFLCHTSQMLGITTQSKPWDLPYLYFPVFMFNINVNIQFCLTSKYISIAIKHNQFWNFPKVCDTTAVLGSLVAGLLYLRPVSSLYGIKYFYFSCLNICGFLGIDGRYSPFLCKHNEMRKWR
jgi:hypothetical protein